MIKVTAENYYSKEVSQEYMSASQYKAFLSCEAAALAEIRGEYERPVTTALLIGSFVDAHFEGTLDLFVAKHPEIFKRDGTLKSEYEHAEYIISRIEAQPEMMYYFDGEKQKIFTGEIAGVPFRCKVDVFKEAEAIVDGKIMKDFEDVYVPEQGRLPWYEAWGYDKQGAIYQELVRQNSSQVLPFILNAATKEPEPDLDLLQLNQAMLDFELEKVEENAPRFDGIKKGILEPVRCEKCAYCRRTKKVRLKMQEVLCDGSE